MTGNCSGSASWARTQYQPSGTSAALPLLPIAELSRFLDQRYSLDETALIREFRAWVRERFGSA